MCCWGDYDMVRGFICFVQATDTWSNQYRLGDNASSSCQPKPTTSRLSPSWMFVSTLTYIHNGFIAHRFSKCLSLQICNWFWNCRHEPTQSLVESGHMVLSLKLRKVHIQATTLSSYMAVGVFAMDCRQCGRTFKLDSLTVHMRGCHAPTKAATKPTVTLLRRVPA